MPASLDLARVPTYISPVPIARTGRAPQYEVAPTLDAIEECYRRGWTDGLPVVPPTADKVAGMLATVGLAPEHVIGEVPVRLRVLTAERAAANAVMAGCLPEHFPVVLAAMEAFFAHDPNILHEVSAATNAPGWLILVNGPLRQQLGLACTDNLLSSANRANATIGRAVRLILMNVLESRPDRPISRRAHDSSRRTCVASCSTDGADAPLRAPRGQGPPALHTAGPSWMAAASLPGTRRPSPA
jgi:hypothetical protein